MLPLVAVKDWVEKVINTIVECFQSNLDQSTETSEKNFHTTTHRAFYSMFTLTNSTASLCVASSFRLLHGNSSECSTMRRTFAIIVPKFAIGYVRYISILTWPGAFRSKL